jgi:small-conductance mechanosensitive channel
MFWFLFVIVLLFIGFIYNALEYLQEMFEELSNPSTKSKGIGKLLSVIIVFVGLLIIFFK